MDRGCVDREVCTGMYKPNETVTDSVGTHSTGMHSCWYEIQSLKLLVHTLQLA